MHVECVLHAPCMCVVWVVCFVRALCVGDTGTLHVVCCRGGTDGVERVLFAVCVCFGVLWHVVSALCV